MTALHDPGFVPAIYCSPILIQSTILHLPLQISVMPLTIPSSTPSADSCTSSSAQANSSFFSHSWDLFLHNPLQRLFAPYCTLSTCLLHFHHVHVSTLSDPSARVGASTLSLFCDHIPPQYSAILQWLNKDPQNRFYNGNLRKEKASVPRKRWGENRA